MNHENETIEAVIEEATASVEEAFVAAEEATEAAIEEVQAAIEDADKEVVEGTEHTDLTEGSAEVMEDFPTAYIQNLPDQHPLQGKPVPYKKVGDSLEFTETRNGKEVTLVYIATQVGEQVQYILKK